MFPGKYYAYGNQCIEMLTQIWEYWDAPLGSIESLQ